jgi:transcriptional regulator with XRE-family HTH domain
MINLSVFGERIQLVRDKVLHLTQGELAKEIGSTQVLLSRLENGKGGAINLVFDLVNFLYNKGFNGAVLFDKTFDIEKLTSGINSKFDNTGEMPQSLSKVKAITQSFYEEILKIVNA